MQNKWQIKYKDFNIIIHLYIKLILLSLYLISKLN